MAKCISTKASVIYIVDLKGDRGQRTSWMEYFDESLCKWPRTEAILLV